MTEYSSKYLEYILSDLALINLTALKAVQNKIRTLYMN